MGSPKYELHRNNNEKHHRVCINHFKMTIHEVTVAQFRAFADATHYFTDAEIDYITSGCWSFDHEQPQLWNWRSWANWKSPLKRKVRDNEPVTCVSYYDINQYIDWLNKTTKRHFRLPTEAEWEYAARGDTNTAYYWGNNPDLSCLYANSADTTKFADVHWPEKNNCRDRFFFSAPIKQYFPNKFGLYDMLGNVWEWTCSQYLSEYGGQERECLPPGDQNGMYIAVRGGGWNAGPDRLRVAYRNWEGPWVRMATWGFRLVEDNNYAR